MSPGETARLSGVLHVGSLFGMVLVAVVATASCRDTRAGTLRLWMVGGCLGSGAALAGLAAVGIAGSRRLALAPAAVRARPRQWRLRHRCHWLDDAAHRRLRRILDAGRSREGTRMGLWGAAQAVAFGCGGLGATALSDTVRASRRRTMPPPMPPCLRHRRRSSPIAAIHGGTARHPLATVLGEARRSRCRPRGG